MNLKEMFKEKINKKRIYNNVVSEKKKSIKPSTIIIASAVTIALVTGSILVKRYLDNKQEEYKHDWNITIKN